MSCAKCGRTFRDTTENWICTCKNQFHPRCLKGFVAYANTKQCCKDLFKQRESELSAVLPLPSKGRRGVSSAGAGRGKGGGAVGGGGGTVPARPSLQPDDLDLQLMPVIEPIDEGEESVLPTGWGDLSESAKLDSIMREIQPTRKGVAELRRVMSNVVPVVNKQTQILRRHEDRIAALESGDTSGVFLPTNMLVVDNLPLDCHTIKSAREVVEQILTVLEIPDTISDIQKISDFSAGDGKQCDSVNVSFKSHFIRDFVLETRRNFGKLTHPIVLGQGTDQDLIYLFEFLPQNAYNLLRAAKKKKAQVKWDGYIWVQNTKIMARKGQDRSQKPFVIGSMADLQKIA